MAQQTLPDPVWSSSAELCLGCGYSLHGLATPGRCPECGAPFDARQLFLAGVPNRSRAAKSGWRRFAWTGVITGAVCLTFVWPFLLMFHALVLVIVLVLVGGGGLYLLISSPRERKAVERFVVAPAGIARLPLVQPKNQNRLDTIFIPWSPATAVRLERVGPFWRRLKIFGADAPDAKQQVIFDAGIRCPDAAAADVEAAIRELIQSRKNPPPAALPAAAQSDATPAADLPPAAVELPIADGVPPAPAP